MSILKTIYLQHLNGGSPNATLDANGNMTVTGTVAGAYSEMFRNRIINGDMRIDQRNAGAAVTANGSFPVDRFGTQITYGSLSLQQSSTAPSGFKTSVAVTVTTGGSTISSDRNSLYQWIEGYNMADLGFGSATASSITLSFWVRSSLTGTFSGCVSNYVIDRSYVFTYSINLANTWEYKTITIPGETSGTWNITNGQGLRVAFDLGTGTSRQFTAGSWQSSDYRAATGAVQLSNTTGATWYITGVQLEPGTSATPFERRAYGHELALCQRYFQLFSFSGYQYVGVGQAASSTGQTTVFKLATTMRSAPTLSSAYTTAANTFGVGNSTNTTLAATSITLNNATADFIAMSAVVSSGLTAGNASMLGANNTAAKLAFESEL